MAVQNSVDTDMHWMHVLERAVQERAAAPLADLHRMDDVPVVRDP